MLDNTLTLSVDVANNATLVNRTYRRYEENLNRSVYVGPNHTLQAKDTLTFYRTAPKPSGNFRGTAKTSFKFSQDQSVLAVDGISHLTAPVIVEVSFSVPVGVTPAQVLELRQRVIALLDSDNVMNNLNNTLEI